MNYIQIWFGKVMLCLLGYVNAMVQIVRMWLDITSPIWERIIIEWFYHDFAGMKLSFERAAVTLFAELGVVCGENVSYSNLTCHSVDKLLTGLRVLQFRC